MGAMVPTGPAHEDVLRPALTGPRFASDLAFVSLQLAFQRGTALATAGVSTLLTNVLPILAGLIIFAEHLPGGAAGIVRALGFAATVLGATMLAGTGRAGPVPEASSGRPTSLDT